MGGEVQEMQLHDHLSRSRSANRARRTGQVRASPAACGACHLFLLLGGISLQPYGGIQSEIIYFTQKNFLGYYSSRGLLLLLFVVLTDNLLDVFHDLRMEHVA